MNETAVAERVETTRSLPATVVEHTSTTVAIPQTQPFCLVTGASRGLGLALAEECARLGMNLVLVALPDTGLPEVSHNLAQTYGTEVKYRELDLSEPDSQETLYRWVREERLAVNMLINNAGIGTHGPFFESAPERNRAMIDLNISALVHLTQLFLPELRRQQNAYILNVASLAAFYAIPYKPVYAPTKAFVLNFSLALRAELAGTAVTVSTLCPGGIMTNEECRKLIAAQGFIGRISCHHPEEVARYALRQLLRNRAVIIPGLINKLARILGKMAPLPLTQLFIRSRFHSAVGGRPATDRNPVPPAGTHLMEIHNE
jgi:short-subunit dehydrogenase